MEANQDPTGELISVWREEYKIPSEDIDFNGKLKFHSLCGYFFEIASQHANHLHFGYKDLKQSNFYWVLSRLQVKVNRYPGFDQRIVIETWHKGINRLFGLRDFRMLDIDGHEMVLATSAWLVLEKKTGRPVKPDGFTELYRSRTEHHAIMELPDKIDPLTDPDGEKLITPCYTDFDINWHVNAGRYIAWIQDLSTPEFYKTYQISEFQINYLNETRFDEKIRIFSRQDSIQNNQHSIVEGRINSTGNPAFRAYVSWTKK